MKEGYVMECRNLTKKFGNFTALKQIDLKLERGRIIGLLGPNGSGKTTLIKLLNGLLVPTEGEILVNGKAPCPETKAKVSYLPDNNYLSSWMSVHQMINYYGDFYADFDKQKAYDMLANLGLDPKQRFKTMSKGMKEKVQLVLVMSRNADLKRKSRILQARFLMLGKKTSETCLLQSCSIIFGVIMKIF